jgi:hypothetical protein
MKLFKRPRFWILSATAVILFYAAAAYYGSSRAIGEHPQWRKFVAVPADFGLTAEVLSFDSPDGVPLKGWWLPAKGTARADVVLAHGQDANRSHMLARANFLVRNQYSVFDIDLRAHGESGGAISHRGTSRLVTSWPPFGICDSAGSAFQLESWGIPMGPSLRFARPPSLPTSLR